MAMTRGGSLIATILASVTRSIGVHDLPLTSWTASAKLVSLKPASRQPASDQPPERDVRDRHS